MAEEVSDPRHDALFLVLRTLPSDFAPWGTRSRQDEPGPDCSAGCRWLIPLEDWPTGEWGICHNPKSPRAGLLTFQSLGCREFEGGTEAPAPSLAPADREARERALLAALHARHDQLAALLARYSGHVHYEDPVYRFYNQSYKVFLVQGATQAIVSELAALLPDQPLHPLFVEIVSRGTEQRFGSADGGCWREATEPLLEAFFHARYFLEMAVRYAKLTEPPAPLPSGYAALLNLFGLR
jgi:hypothetical protein